MQLQEELTVKEQKILNRLKERKSTANGAYVGKSFSNVAVLGVEHTSKFTNKEEDNRNKITDPQPTERL
jgi:hypothetical protein